MKKKISNPDVANSSPEYWEKVLASHGFGVDQPMTDNSEDDEASAESPNIPRHSSLTQRQNDLMHLRTVVDGDDRFMMAHEVKKIRGLYNTREVPSWTQNDRRVREVLLTAFPKLEKSETQRKRAGRWVKFIYLYYRLNLPRPIIMKEMNLTNKDIDNLVQSLDYTSKGLTAKGGVRVSVPLMRESGEGRHG